MLNFVRRTIEFVTPTSLAGKAALTTIALVLALVSGSLTYSFVEGKLQFIKDRVLSISLLSIAIPTLVYIGVRISGGEETSLYPDIDEAWKAGIESLNQVGLAPASGKVPFFLVLGGGSVEEAFVEQMRATGETFRVRAVPAAGNSAPALRWYATDSAVYLFCATVGAVGRLVESWTSPERLIIQNWGQSITPGEVASASRSASSRQRLLNTFDPNELRHRQSGESAAGLSVAATGATAGPLPTNVSYREEAARLTYLCGKINRTRRPRCGVNGAVAILPFELCNAKKAEIDALAESLQKDIHIIHRTLQLRFPIQGLVVGCEQAVGFNEFARLLGSPFIYQRLGARFEVYQRVTNERLRLLSDRICDSFEMYVYALFDRPNTLADAATNRKLYRLLCQMRRQMKPKLCQLLTASFGSVDRQHVANSIYNGDEPPAYFGGCYLASTGNQTEEQAFVQDVFFGKLLRQQGKVEWTYEARRRQFQFKVAVFVGWALVAVSAVLLVL